MIVRDCGDAWQIVLQTDHGETCGALARAWTDRGPRHASLALAAERHDDGWAVWEQSPQVDAHGTPINFLDVQIGAHLAFYRACIASVSDEDAYAGLLVSMHGTGIYRQRYGFDPDLRLTHSGDARSLVEAFVAEQEATHNERATRAGVDEALRWADYRRLQLFDALCLYFCRRDVDAGAPANVLGLALEPLAPWAVRVHPFPFGSTAVSVTLRRRLVPKRDWTADVFRRAFWDTEPIDTRVELHP